MSKIQGVRLNNLPDKYYKFIGEVMFHWVLFDAQVMDMVGNLLKLGPKERRMLVGSMDEKAKLGTLRLLSKKRIPDKPLQEAIAAVSRLASDLSERRNQLAHTPWVKVPGETTPALLSMKGGELLYMPTAEIMTEAQMQDTLAAFRDLTTHGQVLNNAILLYMQQAK